MELSDHGAELIKSFESCARRTRPGGYEAYRCPAGVLTIGWGHTNDHGRKFEEHEVWSQEECDAAFDDDMAAFKKVVGSLVAVPLKQHQFDALVSFAYNCGGANLRSSTLLKKVNAGDFDGAVHEFSRWVRGGGQVLPGLVRRRAAEALMFQGVADHDFDGRPDTMARRVDSVLPA